MKYYVLAHGPKAWGVEGKRWQWVEMKRALRFARHQDAADYMAAEARWPIGVEPRIVEVEAD